jgi:hypothetical protein
MQFVKENFLKKYFNVSITPADVNIKYQCATHYKTNTAKDFQFALEKVKGNIKSEDKNDVSFNTLLYTAVNYFFDSIHGTTSNDVFKPHKVKDEFYTIRYIKQCFDNCNYTGFVPKERFVNEFVNLENALYFKECYLVIQTAFFYDSVFGAHQFLEYTEYFATTGKMLPIDNYKYDVDVLEKKYNDIADDKTKLINSISNYLYLWYYSAIELILNESSVKNNNFRQTERNNEFRIYNALAMCPRTLRYEQAFKMILCDISSAYPTMIDKHVGSDLGSTIYDNLAKEKNITRIEAKRLFNKALNSSKYRPLNSKKRDDYFGMLLDCGYTSMQGIKIITEVTDSKKFKFFDWASKKERELIEQFKKENGLVNGSRIHDALLFLYDSNFDYSKLNLKIDIFNFSFEFLNEPILNKTFFNSKRYIKRKNISFIPKEIGLANVQQDKLPSDVKGSFFDVVDVTFNKGVFSIKNNIETSLEKNIKVKIDVTFYNDSYQYIHANFKTETFDKEFGLIYFINTYSELKTTIINSLRIVKSINENFVDVSDLITILNRYKKLSNLCFDVHTLANDILNTKIKKLNDFEYESKIETRDYSINSDTICEDDFAFNIALNVARAKVNDVYYFNLILNWFKDNPDTFLRCEDIGLNENNKRLKSIVNAFNILFTGGKNSTSRTVLENFRYTYDNTNHKYQDFISKSVRDSRNKTRNTIRINKLEEKLTNLKKGIDTIEQNQRIILNYFATPGARQTDVLDNIDFDKDVLKSILDLKATPPIKQIEPAEDVEYNTDYNNSIFYHKVPKYKEFIKQKNLKGYDLEFYKFHSDNWNEVLEQMKSGATQITPKEQFYKKAS